MAGTGSPPPAGVIETAKEHRRRSGSSADPADGVVALADLDRSLLGVAGLGHRGDARSCPPSTLPVPTSRGSGSLPAATQPSTKFGSRPSASATRYQPRPSTGIGPRTTSSSNASGSRPVAIGRSTPGRLRTRRPSIDVATISPASKSGAIGSGVGEGVGVGDGVGTGVGDGVGVGEGVGRGVGDSSGNVQAPRSRDRTIPIGTRAFPTERRVPAQLSRRGTSAASRSAISRAFVVP